MKDQEAPADIAVLISSS